MATPSLHRVNTTYDGRFGRARWQDFRPNVVSVGSAAAALTRQVITVGGFLFDHFAFNQDDTLCFSFQMKHEWVIGTPIRPHIHAIPTSAVVGSDATVLGNVYTHWRWAWTCIGSGLKFPIGAAIEEQYITTPITIGDQLEEITIGPTLTPPVGFGLSGHLHIEVSRLGLSAAQDTYHSSANTGIAAANLALASVDAHALVKSTGSKEEFSD